MKFLFLFYFLVQCSWAAYYNDQQDYDYLQGATQGYAGVKQGYGMLKSATKKKPKKGKKKSKEEKRKERAAKTKQMKDSVKKMAIEKIENMAFDEVKKATLNSLNGGNPTAAQNQPSSSSSFQDIMSSLQQSIGTLGGNAPTSGANQGNSPGGISGFLPNLN